MIKYLLGDATIPIIGDSRSYVPGPYKEHVRPQPLAPAPEKRKKAPEAFEFVDTSKVKRPPISRLYHSQNGIVAPRCSMYGTLSVAPTTRKSFDHSAFQSPRVPESPQVVESPRYPKYTPSANPDIRNGGQAQQAALGRQRSAMNLTISVNGTITDSPSIKISATKDRPRSPQGSTDRGPSPLSKKIFTNQAPLDPSRTKSPFTGDRIGAPQGESDQGPSLINTNTPTNQAAYGSPKVISPSILVGSPCYIKETPWQDQEIPEELGMIEDDAPMEIQNIIQESLDEHRAMQASRIHAQAFVSDDTLKLSGRLQAPPSLFFEISEKASARSSPASNFTSMHSLNRNGSIDSATSFGSENAENGLLWPPNKQKIYDQLSTKGSSESPNSSSSQTSLSASMAAVESKLNESKERTTKSYNLFKLLPGRRKSKGLPPPESPKTEPAFGNCTGCFEEIPNKKAVKGLLCRHAYCTECFSQLVSTTIDSEATFPPKCCLQEIPKKLLRTHLTAKELAAYDEKALEYAVPMESRYYCISRECGKWIDTRTAKRSNGALECPHCRVKLCSLCRGPQHPSNEECPQDYDLDATLEQAERAGWQRCYRCRAMVELNSGCRHITCKCRAEFCYTCGAKWQTCRCTEDDQRQREHDLAALRQRLDADAQAEEAEVKAAIAAVQAAERQLQQEQEAEEARLEEEAQELAKREFERLERIADHFEYLRSVLGRIRFQQRKAIEERHDKDAQEVERMENDLPNVMAETEREISARRERRGAKIEDKLKVLRKIHAAQMIETIQRHRKAQDELLVRVFYSPDADIEIATKLGELVPAQEVERSALELVQSREIEKLRLYGERILNGFDTKMLVLERKKEEVEKINEGIKALKKAEFADLKWFKTIFMDRVTMVAEDEQKMIMSGSEVPGGGPR